MWKSELGKGKLQLLLLSLGIVLISLVLNPLTSYSQEIKRIPGTITSGDIGPSKQISTPVAPVGQAWVLVNTIEPVICYEEKTGSQMILQLENARDYKTQVDDLRQGNIELEKQIALLKESNKLQNEQFDISKRTIESYKELLKVQKEAYERQIDNVKPSIWDKIFSVLGGIGLGILVGILL